MRGWQVAKLTVKHVGSHPIASLCFWLLFEVVLSEIFYVRARVDAI